jgi:hypothetical protein
MPLFPFVWQYSNQPIDVLAENIAELVVNSNEFIPVSNGISFQNSTIVNKSNLVKTEYLNTDTGLLIDYAAREYYLGHTLNNQSRLEIIDAQSKFTWRTNPEGGPLVAFGLLGSQKSLTVTGNMVASAAGPAVPMFLKIQVDGVDYRIQLLNLN